MTEKLNFDELQPSAFEAIVGGADNDAQVQGFFGLIICCNGKKERQLKLSAQVLKPDAASGSGGDEGGPVTFRHRSCPRR